MVGPKGLLRLTAAQSRLDEMTPGTHFRSVIQEEDIDPGNTNRVIFCSGKLFYELKQKRTEFDRKDVALIRLEELCPFPHRLIQEEVQKYPKVNQWIWVQEEPQNAGAYSYIEPRLRSSTGIQLKYVGRPPLGAPAVGIAAVHRKQLEDLFQGCFAE